MFHQANLRVTDVSSTTINGVTKQRSLLQMWVETIVNRFTSLTTWPLITLKQDDLVTVFMDRMTKDQCQPKLRNIYSATNTTMKITGFEVSASGNQCSVPIPVTIPGGTVTSLQGSTTEQVGNDPLTLWVPLSGAAKTFQLSIPLTV